MDHWCLLVNTITAKNITLSVCLKKEKKERKKRGRYREKGDATEWH